MSQYKLQGVTGFVGFLTRLTQIYESCLNHMRQSHLLESRLTHTSHVSHMKESCLTHMRHFSNCESRLTHMSHVTHMNESCLSTSCKASPGSWAFYHVSLIYMSHVSLIRDMSHSYGSRFTYMSHVTHMDESCLTTSCKASQGSWAF